MPRFYLVLFGVCVLLVLYHYSTTHVRSIKIHSGSSRALGPHVVVWGKSKETEALLETLSQNVRKDIYTGQITIIPYDPYNKKKVPGAQWVIEVLPNNPRGIWRNNTKATEQLATNVAQEFNRHMAIMTREPIQVFTIDSHPRYENYVAISGVDSSEIWYLLMQILWRTRTISKMPSIGQ